MSRKRKIGGWGQSTECRIRFGADRVLVIKFSRGLTMDRLMRFTGRLNASAGLDGIWAAVDWAEQEFRQEVQTMIVRGRLEDGRQAA